MHRLIDILLVEDNMNDAELTIRELKRYNISHNLVHLTDGEQALDFIFGTGTFRERNIELLPKVILLDIQMPKVNGIEVLQKIKSNQLTKKIPVVMLTSSKEDLDIKKCYEAGANSYIVKPVDFKDFSEAIKSVGFYWLFLNQTAL